MVVNIMPFTDIQSIRSGSTTGGQERQQTSKTSYSDPQFGV